MTLLSLFILHPSSFILFGLGDLPSWPLLFSGGTGSATMGLPFLADGSLPDAHTIFALGYWWVILVVIVGGVSTLLGLVLTVWLIVDRIKGRDGRRIVTNNPLIVAEATRFVENDHLTLTLSRYVSKDDLRNSERHIEEQIDHKFTLLDTKRSEDIGDLHKKIEATTESLRAEIEDKMKEVRSTINDLPEKLFNMLRGRKP